MKRLHALSLRLATTKLLADVLNDVLRTASSLVGARLGSVQVLTPDGDLGMVGQVGFGDILFERFSVIRLEDCSTCAVALRRRERVSVRNLHTDVKFSDIAAALRSYGVVAAVSTPVLDTTRNVLAMFSVYWLEEHEPTDRELRALDLCAELAGRHVERHVAAKALRDREQLLMRELAHRGKNLVSVIQAIAMRSLTGEQTLDDARNVFIGRLRALANTYNTLTEEAPESVNLYDIVSGGLKSIGDRINICGPVVFVPAKNAQTLSLVFHELATNAAKYGALSVGSGRITVNWEHLRNGSSEERFRFIWSETGGPPASPPARKGFGSVIITSVIGAELNCVPIVEYAEDGFRYQLECSLKTLTGN
ncbi:MAG: GAF domain-containing protein [Chitinophagales bacterium]|nr:GAF domain-containing protein [Hyphomicrobiales bacterium]